MLFDVVFRRVFLNMMKSRLWQEFSEDLDLHILKVYSLEALKGGN